MIIIVGHRQSFIQNPLFYDLPVFFPYLFDIVDLKHLKIGFLYVSQGFHVSLSVLVFGLQSFQLHR